MSAVSLQRPRPSSARQLSAHARASREELAAPLAFRGVTKRWRRDQPPVLDELCLTLEPGTMTWIGGRNGAGKTTLLRIAAGLIEPDRGRAEVWGFTARENRVRYQRLVSFLAAGDRGLYARLSVRRHLDFCARIAMIPRERLRDAVCEAIDAFQLHELIDRRVDRMSMGQRQRLRLAMTILPAPEVVLLDEPLTSLDAQGCELLLAAAAGVMARGGLILWCSPEDEPGAWPDARFTLEHGTVMPA